MLQAQVQQLLDERDCRQLLERYTYALDWMNWEGLTELFWRDAAVDFGLWSGDRDGFIPWVAELESGYRRRLHLFGIPRLHVAGGSGRAETTAAMFFRLGDDVESGSETGPQDELMFGRYLFEFQQREEQWRISSLRCLLHGAQRFAATDDGGADFFADGLSTVHPLFAQ